MGFFKKLLGPVLGGGLGYLLAPFTGGLSVPLSMGIGAGLGGAAQTALGGGDLGESLLSGGLSGLGGYGVGSLLPAAAAPAIGATTMGTSAPGLGSMAVGPHGMQALSGGIAPGATSIGGMGISGLALPSAAKAGAGSLGSFNKAFAGATGTKGALSTIGKYAPLAIGADYLAKSAGIESEQDAMQDALTQYLGEHKGATEWTDSDRKSMMKAIMGIYSEDVEAAKRKSASSMAERGVAGGAYGKRVGDIERRGREAAARSLATTYGPSGQPPSASAFYSTAKSKGRHAGAETAGDVLNLGGQLSMLALMNQLFR